MNVSEVTLEKNTIKLYPVPANGELTISKNIDTIGDIKIFDIQGKLLHTQYIELIRAKIDTRNFSSTVFLTINS